MKNLRSNYAFAIHLIWVSTFTNPIISVAQQTLGSTQNTDESKVVHYELPALLTTNSGETITNTARWEAVRRREIIEILTREVYGAAPKANPNIKYLLLESSDNALSGLATRKQVRILFNGQKDGPFMDLLIYLPKAIRHPVPLVVGFNFQGNHAAVDDREVILSQNWIPTKGVGVVNNHATEMSRGSNASVWPIEKILKRGYGVATMYAGDIDPDYDDGYQNGIHTLYAELQLRQDNFSTIAAWAWGLSRAMDYLQTNKAIDAKRIVLTGFSRMGKAALWAGALDKRFALVISNESGKGGASLWKRNFGETMEQMNTKFPHWFNKNFKKYTNNQQNIPFDQHMVLALIAPRPLYVGSAAEDNNADPKGEFLALKAVEPVYQLYGIKGINSTIMPPVNKSEFGVIGYHIRNGGHGMTDFDWKCYLDFADRNLKQVK